MINGKQQLIDNGLTPKYRKLRQDALDIIEAALESVDPRKAVNDILRIEDDVLVIDKLRLPFDELEKIMIVGGGKASGIMVEAVESILGDQITGGNVNVLRGTKDRYQSNWVNLNPAGHPVPDEDGVQGVKDMLQSVSGLSKNDLVLALISGGGSAIMPLPAPGVALEILQDLTRKLLAAGATINELNAVRKHLSSFKGGQLARECSPARVVSLILSDVIGDPLDTIASGPTAPDSTTFQTAIDVLKKYSLWDNAAPQIRDRFELGLKGVISETSKPNDPVFDNVHNVIIANNLIAAEAASKKANELGYNSKVQSTSIDGEAKQVGELFSGIARDLINHGKPMKPPAVLVLGGETTVTVTGSGVGGRNQEVSLSSIPGLSGLNCVILALGTDGIDGPTDAAGAMVDGASLRRAQELGLDVTEYLMDNDSYNFFKKLGDLIITGPTGTNVNDLTLILADG
ncbi:MAG: glycerate kinase [Candidatus Bathyarchaeota archaeon]|nr:glycerate kinase [Candidatus Bathyarchaeota archaeon]